MTDASGATDRLNAALEGRYRVERELGEGGMATVYLADDLKHDRKVAIKVLKPELAAVIGGERFVAEIKTTAGLQHPHILPLFDSGEADGFLYYVMPYVEGETLRERLDREKQLGVEEALSITEDVADALDYAHRQGVIHRDIKPANILLHDGRPVVADFGIAVAISAAGGGRMTETGLSLGTPHYMSPEQATADRDLTVRSDVYSLACVLYEMLAGDPPHTGPTAQSVLVRILTERPRPVSDTRTSVPPHVVSVLAKALEKLPADRFESAAEFRGALERTDFTYVPVRRGPAAEVRGQAGDTRGGVGAGAGPAGPAGDGSRRPPRSGLLARYAPWAVAAAAVVVAGVAALGGSGPTEGSATYRMDVDLSDFELGSSVFGSSVQWTISPDASMIAVAAERDGEEAIFVRSTDEADFRKIPGTERGTSPSFSPDGEWVVFRDPDDDVLRKITVAGGGATTLVNVDSISPYLPHWGTDEQIVFTGPDGVFVTSATSGSAESLVAVTGGSDTPADPFLLPDGTGVLTGSGPAGFGGEEGIRLHDLDSDSVRTLVPDGHSPSYVDTGHILYVASDGGLFAIPFDLDSRTVSGTPTRVLDRVAGGAGSRTYEVSASGSLLHVEGPPAGTFDGNETRLLLVDAEGRTEMLPPRAALRWSPRFSPNGRSLAYEVGPFGESNIFTYDLLTQDEEQLTTTGDNRGPIWSADGEWIGFASSRKGTDGLDIFVAPADNSRPAQRVDSAAESQYPTDWLEDDRLLYETEEAGNSDVYIASLTREAEAWSFADARPYLPATWSDYAAVASPDAALVAHLGTETEQPEIWLRTFPDPISRFRVTTREDCCPGQPRWSPDGSTVYFIAGTQAGDTLYSVRVERDPPRPLDPEPVFALPAMNNSHFDVHPDGNRFLVTVPAEDGSPETASSEEGGADQDDRIRYFMVINWRAELERKLAGR